MIISKFNLNLFSLTLVVLFIKVRWNFIILHGCKKNKNINEGNPLNGWSHMWMNFSTIIHVDWMVWITCDDLVSNHNFWRTNKPHVLTIILPNKQKTIYAYLKFQSPISGFRIALWASNVVATKPCVQTYNFLTFSLGLKFECDRSKCLWVMKHQFYSMFEFWVHAKSQSLCIDYLNFYASKAMVGSRPCSINVIDKLISKVWTTMWEMLKCTNIVDEYENQEDLHNEESFHTPLNCRNPNIGSVTKCEMQGPMRLRVCLGVKHTFTNGGECKGWSPMTPKCTPTLGTTLVQELQMFRALVGKVNKHQIGPLGYH